MTMKANSPDFPDHEAENQRIWNTNAIWWDDEIGDGNEFQEVLIEPAPHAGRVARQLARRGGEVIAIDHSEQFIQRAIERTQKEGVNVEYHVMDATDEGALLSLGASGFDSAMCTMALMDMPCIEPLFGALARLLKPGGVFLFSIVHPCFHSAVTERYIELREESSGRHRTRKGIKLWHYLSPEARLTEGIIGQPEPQYYFHRPLQALLAPALAAGLMIDALEEPGFPADETDPDGLRWIDIPEIPAVMVVRMRLTN